MLNIVRMVGGHHAMAFTADGAGNLTVEIPFMAALGAMMVIMTAGIGGHIAAGAAYRTVFGTRFVTVETHFKAPFLTYFKFICLTLI